MSRSAFWLTAGLIPLLSGCMGVGQLLDPSVVPAEHRAPSEKVENGTAYDRATIDLSGVKKVVLPTEAIVHRTEPAGSVQLLMAKQLWFAGHPGETMSIRQTRKKLGCASRKEGTTLTVAIYGEWDSGVEGGAYVKLVAVVPQGVEVEQRPGLSKPLGVGNRAWNGLSLPADGWTAIPDTLGVNRSARE